MNRNLAPIFVLFTIFTCSFSSFAQQRPKIGLTLSGGGAKGLAHIGLLKAIDSAGIRVDYVTGTSMGSIVGSLYAAGYTGKEIEKMMGALNWQTLMSNEPSVEALSLSEKKNLGKYIGLPIRKGRLQLKRGFIESNELWLALSEVFYPYYETTDFNHFDKPFQCIATDVATGKMVVLKDGNIVSAVRASMAIPSIFTPVEIDGKILVDGGLIRNFPVENAKEMGADFIIGSDVSGSLEPVEQIKSPMDVISRLPFYNAVTDLETQKKLVDFYVNYPLEKFGTSSFAASDKIIEIGNKKAMELYPKLKRLKDSLDLKFGSLPKKEFVKKPETVVISNVEVTGISASEKDYFLRMLALETGRDYNAKQISERVRSTFSTRIYDKLQYSLKPSGNGQATILFEVEKATRVTALFGLHYNTTTGIALKTGVEKRGIFSPLSTAFAMVAIGENPRGQAIVSDYLNTRRNISVQAEVNFSAIDLTTYDGTNFTENGLYQQSNQNCDLQVLWQPGNRWTIGLGSELTNLDYRPKIASDIQAKGNTYFLNSYLTLHHNTLNADVYPTKGRRFYLKGGVIYGQKNDFSIYEDGEIVADENSPYFDTHPYGQIKFSFEQYFPFGRHALLLNVQSGMNFGYKQFVMNDFIIGGLTSVIRNQITFAGLPEGSIFSPSVISAQIGYQYNVVSNLYLIFKANTLYHDFIDSNLKLRDSSHGTGFSVTGGYKTFLGPIEASLMYSDLNKELLPYFNLGYVLALD
ncbi:patatin-like phospholipase family protein [Flavobacterium sp.]|uniref:patatin-like phospholipase family protein n=1 Tax=Flavobacterium sp. TaxID=239 RepID=UPI0025C05294|nr:patatin-like phospholipase family protein [Flavobacterium sp.]